MTGPNGQTHRETGRAAQKRELAAAIAWLEREQKHNDQITPEIIEAYKAVLAEL